MRLGSHVAWASFLGASWSHAYWASSTIGTDVLAEKGYYNLEINQWKQIVNGDRDRGDCTLQTAAKRREWSTLQWWERQAYINAVLCLMRLPSRTDPTVVPGAKTRYDDFVWTHINQTMTIHGTGSFLSWHRYFTWAYEQALRDECGYQGYQPYWNWGKSAHDPINSPYFDGSPWSMSGNGEYEAHNCTPALPNGLKPCIPPGQGGGCVKSGPFRNMVVNLGPVANTLLEPEENKKITGPEHNPRCLKRDISVWVSSQWSTDQQSVDLITKNNDIASFQTTMQGNFSAGFYGVHTAGHFTWGGDPGGDLFSSPGDPAFYLHHGQIDRTWWIWQNQDLANRLNAVGGTNTLNNNPPSPNTTLNDVIWLDTLADQMTIGDVMSTLDGPFCYIYV